LSIQEKFGLLEDGSTRVHKELEVRHTFSLRSKEVFEWSFVRTNFFIML
jgi:hypothetical protein